MSVSIPCAHIADYYQQCWEMRKCIAFNLLRIGYRQLAEGRADQPTNNLYDKGEHTDKPEEGTRDE